MRIKLFHKHQPKDLGIEFQGEQVYSCDCGEYFAPYINLLKPGQGGWLKFRKEFKSSIQELVKNA